MLSQCGCFSSKPEIVFTVHSTLKVDLIPGAGHTQVKWRQFCNICVCQKGKKKDLILKKGFITKANH